jgi:TolA-binding protein
MEKKSKADDASDPSSGEHQSAPDLSEITRLQARITELNRKLENMDQKFIVMNDKLNATRSTLDRFIEESSQPASMIQKPSNERQGSPISTFTTDSKNLNGFTEDHATQKFRNSMVLFNAKRYHEAILAFADFLKEFADHSLAGSAQYYIAEAYFKNNEYRLAEQEYRRVLISYDRSSHTPATLLRLKEIQSHLNHPEKELEYQELLLSLFPQSPAAEKARRSVLQE